MNEQIPQFYQFGEFRLDASKRLLSRNGKSVALMPKAFDVLLTLVQNRGQVVTKDDLMASVWRDTLVEENSLNVNVSALRKIFGEKPNEHRFIVTVPGVGYEFVADVQTEGLPKPNSLHILPPGKETSGNMFSRINQRPLLFLILTAIFLTLIVFTSSLFKRQSSISADAPETTQSIAVLPFSNESGDPNLDYLSDGLSESILDRLSQLPQLKVIARNSSFKHRGTNLDLQEVANALGVQVIVMGRVVQRDDNLLVRVEMIDIHENKQIWGEQFNRKATETLSLQQEIAQTVSEKLRLKLSGVQETQLTKRETNDAEAYDARLKGKFFAKKAQLDSSLDDGTKAIEYFQQAIARDPNYALAYVGLAGVYQFLGANSYLNPKETKGEALKAALKALELDENLAEAHLALANFKKNAWQWGEAESGFKRAIELNPNLPSAHAGYSDLLSYTGRHEQAIAEVKLARNLDPVETRIMWNLAQKLYYFRRYDEAIDILEQMLEMKENKVYGYALLGDIYSMKGMHSEALNAYKKTGTNLSSSSDDVYLGRVYARAGNSEKARAILKQAQTGRKYVSPAELAFLFAVLNDREQAFALLEKAYAEHDVQLVFLNVDPVFDSLRDDPRFRDLIRRVGLPQ